MSYALVLNLHQPAWNLEDLLQQRECKCFNCTHGGTNGINISKSPSMTRRPVGFEGCNLRCTVELGRCPERQHIEVGDVNGSQLRCESSVFTRLTCHRIAKLEQETCSGRRMTFTFAWLSSNIEVLKGFSEPITKRHRGF